MRRTTSDFRTGAGKGALNMISSDKSRPCAKFELNEEWRIHKILASRNCDELIDNLGFIELLSVICENRQPFRGVAIRDRV